MATRKVLLDEDNTGLLPANFIQDEEVDIGIGRNRLVRFKYGAFYTEGLQILDVNGTEITQEQYMPTDLHTEGTQKSGKAVWNAIVITDQTVSTKITGSYHGYGGRFSLNGQLLVEWLNEKLSAIVDPIEWLALRDRPKEYVAEYHKHLWSEVYGWSYFKRPLDNIENAIRLDTSFFYKLLVSDIQKKLTEANQRAMDISNFYATKAVSDATVNIDKERLGIHLLANYSTATPVEMQRMGKENFDSSLLIDDKYINKKGLIAFMEEVHARSVKISETNLGTREVFVRDSARGALISLGNAGIATFESKKELIKQNIFYEENVYPKEYPEEDRFTVLRVTHNQNDHGGVFLGFNNTTAEMYSGTLKDDSCFMRIKWYKFYSELTYNSIKSSLEEHVKATNNPHKLTKDQVMLGNVKNLPVATLEEILSGEPTDSYLTLDGLQALMAKNLLNLKPEFKEDGTLDKDSDLFNKPNIIFTPCDKKVPDNCPPAGQLLKTYCDGSDRFARKADGKCGFTDEVLELNSDDCNYFEIRPQGEVLYKICKEKDQYSIISDGRGGTTEVLSTSNSLDCGYIPPPEIGTVISEECDGVNKIRKYADGMGGVTTSIIEPNSMECGFTTTTTTTIAPVTYEKQILLYSTHRDIEVGTNETFTAYFSNFPPNTVVGFTMQHKQPLGNEYDKEWHDIIDGTVNIDTAGAGTWTKVVVDGGTIPRNTVWNNQILDHTGLTSNLLVRNFVGAGNAVTQPPIVIPTTPPPPPVNVIKPTITFGPAGPWTVDGRNLSPPVRIDLTNGAPNTNYYFKIWMRRYPWATWWSDPKWGGIDQGEVFNGTLSTNSQGVARFYTTQAVIFAAGGLGAGGAYATVSIYNPSELYVVLTDEDIWSEMILAYNTDNSQTG